MSTSMTMVSKRAAALGLKVVDAKQALTLQVTKGDIRVASQKNPTCCAFALAALRAMPRVRHAYFYRSVAWLEYPDKMVRYALSAEAMKAIATFDKDGTMAPEKYDLRVVRKSERRGSRAKRNVTQPQTRGGGGPKRAVVHQTSQVRARFEPTMG